MYVRLKFLNLFYEKDYVFDIIYSRQRQVYKTRNGDLANLAQESEVMSMKDDFKKVLELLRLSLICLLLSLMALLLK